VKSYGLRQEFITPHCPQQNGMVERVVRTLKEQCVHRQRFDSIQHATRAIGDWISFYKPVSLRPSFYVVEENRFC
jgi:putative transposase